MFRSLCLPSVLAALAPAAAAQTGPAPVNLEVAQTAGPVLAGAACGPISCTPAFGSVHSAIGAELRVWGPPGRFYAVAGSASAPVCQAVPGFGGMLLLAPPAVTLTAGAFPPGQGNACGLVQAPPVPLQFAAGHAGLRFLFQAVTILPLPAAQPGEFSPALSVVVRS